MPCFFSSPAFRRYSPYGYILCFGLVVLVPFLGRVHLFDWDELIFAESAREMMVSGNYEFVRSNFQPFLEKPPLFFWLQAMSMHLFGIHEWAARFPNALCGIATLGLIFYAGNRLENKRVAFLWVAAYACSFLPHLYFKTALIDPWFNFFIFLTLFLWTLYFLSPLRRRGYVIMAGIAMGLALLTKGPVALLLTGLALGITCVLRKKKGAYLGFLVDFLLFCIIVFALISLWLGLEIYRNGGWFVRSFLAYQWNLLLHSYGGHRGFFGYHFVVLALGCFPAVAFLGCGIGSRKKSIFSTLMWVLLLVILVIFSVVQTKLVHYSALAYFPITYFAALSMEQIIAKGKVPIFTKVYIAFVGGLWALLAACLPILMREKNHWVGAIRDPFVQGNLSAQVHWSFWDTGWGVLFLLAVVFTFYAWKRRKIRIGLWVLFIASLVFLQGILFAFVPKVEAYTQRSSVEFWKGLEREDCYVGSLYMKSFAPYFYAKIRMPSTTLPYWDIDFLLDGAIDKPAYFMSRNTDKEKVMKRKPDLIFLYEKNGYCFFKKCP